MMTLLELKIAYNLAVVQALRFIFHKQMDSNKNTVCHSMFHLDTGRCSHASEPDWGTFYWGY